MKHFNHSTTARNVLIFAGSDPSCGAGLQADILAISALGAHPLSVVTALTVQDHNRVYQAHPVAPTLVRGQAEVLIRSASIDAVKIGALGSAANAQSVLELLQYLRIAQPSLPIVLDPVLASGHGDALAQDNMVTALQPFYRLISVITPNLLEARKLSGLPHKDQQADWFIDQGVQYVLIKGGHGRSKKYVTNLGLAHDGSLQQWRWPKLSGEFHGSGCTLASAIAAYLAHGLKPHDAMAQAQIYCQKALSQSYAIGDGQRIPDRMAATRSPNNLY